MRIFPLYFNHLRLRFLARLYAEHLTWIPYDVPGTIMYLDDKAITRAYQAVRKLRTEASIQAHHLAVYERKPFRKLLFRPILLLIGSRCEKAKEAETRFFSNIYNLPRNVPASKAHVDAVLVEASWVRTSFK